ncbi:hypothetical protein AB6A40_005707 [Gnathostoma spinigerum]|uniref:Secreted protein n=1 Tax=Gnathostoma spinigerum TaxID=75299 RepID=A0ABD6EG77_9BILA
MLFTPFRLSSAVLFSILLILPQYSFADIMDCKRGEKRRCFGNKCGCCRMITVDAIPPVAVSGGEQSTPTAAVKPSRDSDPNGYYHKRIVERVT